MPASYVKVYWRLDDEPPWHPLLKIPPKNKASQLPGLPACGILRVSRQPHPNIYHPQMAFRGGIPGYSRLGTQRPQRPRCNAVAQTFTSNAAIARLKAPSKVERIPPIT